MQTKTKQRIIGAIVLLAVVAIFLPVLFHNARPSANLKLSTTIPPAPAKPVVQLQLPAIKSSPAVPSAVNADQAANTQSQSAKEAAAQTPVVTQRILNTPPAPAPKKHSDVKVKRKAVQPTPAAKPMVKAQVKSVAPSLLQSAVPQAWVIQVASFSRQVNAARLVKKLRAQGLDVYTRHSQVDGLMITRVYVGPEINQNKIKKIQRQLRQQFQLKAVIKRYSA